MLNNLRGQGVDIEKVLDCLRNLRASWRSEDELQRSIAAQMQEQGFTFLRERRLSKRDRIDFTIGQAESIGIEVKVDGTFATVAGQILRYCEHECFESIVLVTTVPSHLKLRGMRNGRGIPVYVLFMAFNGI